MTDVQTSLEGATCRHAGNGTPRRAVFAGAGALGAACLLAACGSDTSSSGGTDGGGFSTTPAPAGSAGTNGIPSTGGGDTSSGGGGAALAKVADVPEGGGVIKGDLVITQPAAGEFKAFSKVCTHAGCDVNKVENGLISCPCHGSEFSIEDGAPKSGPAKQALPETKVKKDGDNIVAA